MVPTRTLRALTLELGERVMGDLAMENTTLGYDSIRQRAREASRWKLRVVLGVPGGQAIPNIKMLGFALTHEQ